MTNNRSQNGATLALVVACTIIIILVGIGAFFLMQLLGGQRELQHANDAGDLNIAKQAIVRPNISLGSAGVIANNNFSTLVDTSQPGGNAIDLKVYNRLVGQTLLVAINASAQNTPTSKQNAMTLLNTLQGTGGIGDRLAQALGSSNNTGNFFKDLGLGNTARMIGKDAGAAAGRTDVNFAPGWMERRNTDLGATNVRPPFAAQFPAGFPMSPAAYINSISTTDTNKSMATTQFKVNQPAGARQYIRGYRGLTVPGVPGLQLVGVPVQPGRQPHLVSAFDFNTQQNQPVGGAVVPPNSFQQGVEQKGAFTNKNLAGLSRALVGSLDADYLPAISGGYIRIINAVGVPNAASIINTNTVLNKELDSMSGITLARSGHFSTNPGILDAWDRHNNDRNNPLPHASTTPNGQVNSDFPANSDVTQSGNEIFDQNGNKLTSNQQAHQIGGNTIVCTDLNTFPPGQHGGNTKCDRALDSFERAYTPGYTGPRGWYNNQQPTANGGNLTAVANAKCGVMSQFNSCGRLSIPAGKRSSGMEFYPCGFGTETPWPQGPAGRPDCANAGLKCSISRPGTLAELMSQTSAGNGTVNGARTFLTQRMSQMNPDRAIKNLIPGDVNRALNTVMPMDGQVRFIYYESTGNRNLVVGNSKFVFHSKLDPNPTVTTLATPPTAEGALAVQNPDGRATIYRQAHAVNGSLVNPHHDNHIHDEMFKCTSGQLTATESTTIQPSSGYNNLLGQFSFQETIGGAPYYCCPD